METITISKAGDFSTEESRIEYMEACRTRAIAYLLDHTTDILRISNEALSNEIKKNIKATVLDILCVQAVSPVRMAPLLEMTKWECTLWKTLLYTEEAKNNAEQYAVRLKASINDWKHMWAGQDDSDYVACILRYSWLTVNWFCQYLYFRGYMEWLMPKAQDWDETFEDDVQRRKTFGIPAEIKTK